MDLIYFLKVLYRKKWAIIGLSFLAVVSAFIFLLYKKPLYESEAQYSTGFTAEKVRMVDGTSAVDLYTADVKFNNVIETIKSPQVIGMISYRLILHDINNPAQAYRRLTIKNTESQIYKDVNVDYAKKVFSEKIATGELLNSDDVKETQLIEYLKLYGYDYDGLLKYLTVERVEGTDYLDIVFRSENRVLSALVVNSVGEEFLDYYRSINSQRTQENAQTIREMVDSQQNKVDSIGQTLLKEKISQGSIDPTSKTTNAMETVKELEGKLEEEKGKYNEHYNRDEYLKQELTALQSGADQSSSSNDEVIQLTNKKNELVEELSRKGGSDAALQQQINDLRNQIILKSNSGISKNKINDNIADLKRQISEEEALMNASTSTIDDYNSKIREYLGMSNTNPGSGIKLDALKEQLDIENKELATTKEKYSQVQGLLKDDPTSNFVQTRVGEPAVDPESKKTMLTMALSGMCVFFLTSIFFIFLEIFDPAVKTPSIFSKLSKMKVVSSLNKIHLKHNYVMDIILQENEGENFVAQNIYKNNVRKLRYELINSGKNVFLITSTQKGAGKSTVVEALATSLLLSKKRVLIIDLNFSHDTLTKIFNTEIFIQDIANRIDYSLPFESQKLWSNTMYEDLCVIGCRETNNTPSESLYNIDMTAFLHRLKEHFDFIILEGASLNNYADTKELAQYAEAVFTVFSAASSVSHGDINSFQFIKGLGEKNHNIILNDVLTENINS
jgi:succinoglycan biosynthesis transport protein ExoP